MNTSSYFLEAMALLRKHPKLFLPKLVVAGLFGIGMLLTARLATMVFGMQNPPLSDSLFLLALAFFLLVYTFLVSIFDIIVNAMYPVLLREYREKKQLSFRNALRFSLSKAKVVVPADFSILLLFVAVALPFNYLALYFRSTGNTIGFAGAMLAMVFFAFVFSAGFYWIYPVATMENVGFFGALKRAVFLSGKNLKKVSVASVVPFAVSLTNLFLAFFSESPGFLLLFILMRFFTGVVYTYHLVLNPELYFALGKAGK